MKTFFRAIGIKQIKNSGLKLKNDDKLLNYPLEPIDINVKNKKYNIVWLVAESWRADTLNKKIMPATYNFAKKCFRFHNHYSSGNGTRMALCGMFYGLYGSYWKALLAEHTEPIIFKVLHKLNYQMDLYTSAKFTYPEFDQTIFSSIKKSQMHQSDGRGGYINDKNNITYLLEFIKKRDKNRPFMTFMFFESPHAPYVFPESSVIEKDYLKTFNYTTIDIEKNITKIKNRYINSVHNLDNELKRVFEFLKKENLMDSTIVILTGDHGEEFLEKGHWGHNKGFHQEQIKPAMLLYIPNHKNRDIYKMTSHLDIVPTIAPFLGINNSPSTYSLGYNMLLDETRSFTACASWDQLCYIDDKIKYVIDPVAFNITTTTDDIQLDDDNKNKESNKQIIEMIKNSTKFYKKL
jgi:membrane-anchored protein YejM (alkaline phosphatase superfamily)